MNEAEHFRKFNKRKAHLLAKRGAAERDANAKKRASDAAKVLTMPAPKPRTTGRE